LLGLHEIGSFGWRWLIVDVVWAVGAGLCIGAALGAVTARLVLYLRRQRKEGVGRDEFLVLGLIALAYGSAVLAHAYGFLAVFAAGMALRSVEREHSGEKPPEDVIAVGTASEVAEIATHPEKAPAHMAQAVLTFNEQMERILEVALVLIVGGMFTSKLLRPMELWFIPLLLLVIRPVAVWIGLIRSDVGRTQRRLMAWFGIRGIGSIYYLMFAIERGISPQLASDLIALTLSTIAVSMVVHGISVTPLMKWYEKRALRRRARKSGSGIS
jgi:NhaP-type Na+/H+ or K+/H+ antiporter